MFILYLRGVWTTHLAGLDAHVCNAPGTSKTRMMCSYDHLHTPSCECGQQGHRPTPRQHVVLVYTGRSGVMWRTQLVLFCNGIDAQG